MASSVPGHWPCTARSWRCTCSGSSSRPLAYGYFFSLGHSSIVVAIGVGIIIAEKTVFSAVSNSNPPSSSSVGCSGLYASRHVPWYAILCLPVFFTAGMSLMGTTDGMFVNLAYGWAFFNPVRKVYYNLAITGLSVAICFFIGGVEILGLLPSEIHGLSHHHGFWGFMYNFNINTAGFVIVGMFVVTWALAMAIWRYGNVEEKWGARLKPTTEG